MGGDAKNLYLTYLTNEELQRAIERAKKKLERKLPKRQREVLEGVLEDMRKELYNR